jgi:transcriptional regulator with XRE-family HTH domain
MTLGERIKDLRRQHNLSISELARRAGVSKGYLWSLEHPAKGGKGPRPSAETVYAIAKEFGVTVATLLGREEMPRRRIDLYTQTRVLGRGVVDVTVTLRQALVMLHHWADAYDDDKDDLAVRYTRRFVQETCERFELDVEPDDVTEEIPPWEGEAI